MAKTLLKRSKSSGLRTVLPNKFLDSACLKSSICFSANSTSVRASFVTLSKAFFYQKSSVSMHLASFYDAAIGHQALLK
ncbi:hypothetical protein EFN45_08865 [Leuconostoc citreum]|nr:hypothetical protein [Leuconostoc citreum]